MKKQSVGYWYSREQRMGKWAVFARPAFHDKTKDWLYQECADRDAARAVLQSLSGKAPTQAPHGLSEKE